MEAESKAEQKALVAKNSTLTKQLNDAQASRKALEAEGKADQKSRLAKISTLSKQLEDAQINSQALEVKAQMDQKARFEEIATLTRHLEEARGHFDEDNEKFSSQQAEQGAAWQKAQTLEAALSEAQNELQTLRAENQALSEREAALLNSTSWRITTPIRKVKQALSE